MEGKRGLVGVGRPSRYCVSVKCKSQRESEDLQTKRSGPECWVGREIGREREELGVAEPPARIDGIGNLGVDGGVMVRSGSATGLRYGALGGVGGAAPGARGGYPGQSTSWREDDELGGEEDIVRFLGACR